MAKFVLFYSGGTPPLTQAESKKMKQAWFDWFAQLGDAVLDGGNPFSEHAKTIGSDGSVRNGSGAIISGYSVLEAVTLDEAVSLAMSCPLLQHGGEVSVVKTYDEEMDRMREIVL